MDAPAPSYKAKHGGGLTSLDCNFLRLQFPYGYRLLQEGGQDLDWQAAAYQAVDPRRFQDLPAALNLPLEEGSCFSSASGLDLACHHPCLLKLSHDLVAVIDSPSLLSIAFSSPCIAALKTMH